MPEPAAHVWNGTSYNAARHLTFLPRRMRLVATRRHTGTDGERCANLDDQRNTLFNQLPYVWNGTSYGAAGTYTFTTQTVAGCDSIATLVLTVSNTVTSTTTVSRCQNQLPYVWNGTSYNAAGTYTFTTQTVAGCDSVATWCW